LCAIGRLLGAVSGALRIIRTLAGALGSLTGCDSLTVGIRYTLFRPREIGRQAIDILCVIRELLVLFRVLTFTGCDPSFRRCDGFVYILLGRATGPRETQNHYACHHREIRVHIDIPLSKFKVRVKCSIPGPTTSNRGRWVEPARRPMPAGATTGSCCKSKFMAADQVGRMFLIEIGEFLPISLLTD